MKIFWCSIGSLIENGIYYGREHQFIRSAIFKLQYKKSIGFVPKLTSYSSKFIRSILKAYISMIPKAILCVFKKYNRNNGGKI